MGETVSLTQYFLDMKNEVEQISSELEKDKVYYDFFAYMGLVTTGDEVHASGPDWDLMKLKDGQPNDSGRPDKKGIELTFGIGLTSEIGLKPIDNVQSVIQGDVPYIDEFGNHIPEYNALYSGMGGCGCYVCKLKNKPKELWQPVDVEVAKKTIEFLHNLLKENGPDKVTATVYRTPEELAVLKLKVENEAYKALNNIRSLVKGLLKKGKSREDIKTLIKAQIMGGGREEIVEKQFGGIVKANIEIGGYAINDKLEKSVVDFSEEDLLYKGIGGGHKYIRREGSKGNYKYFYRDENGKEVEGKKPESDIMTSIEKVAKELHEKANDKSLKVEERIKAKKQLKDLTEVHGSKILGF